LQKLGEVRIEKKTEEHAANPVDKIQCPQNKAAAPSTPDSEQNNQQQGKINPIHKIIFPLTIRKSEQITCPLNMYGKPPGCR
jgi:hypothetical protein